jgi:hypothetical protein
MRDGVIEEKQGGFKEFDLALPKKPIKFRFHSATLSRIVELRKAITLLPIFPKLKFFADFHVIKSVPAKMRWGSAARRPVLRMNLK